MINYSLSRYRVKASSETTFRSLAHLPLKNPFPQTNTFYITTTDPCIHFIKLIGSKSESKE